MSATCIPERQRAWLAAQGPRGVEQRRQSLRSLLDGLSRHEDKLLDALRADLGKHPVEAYTSEILTIRQEAVHALKHLARWLRPEKRKVPAMAWPGRAKVHREPCGSVLVIGPWNYPLQLLLTPLVGALAGGNTAVLKPSEHAPATSAAVAELVAACFCPEEVFVVEGDSAVAANLLEQPFDHIFFTGGTATGHKVLAAAENHLVPVTLELGGKCPVLVFPGPGEEEKMRGAMDVIARRIAWGKHLNAGQTCVAPDHVWVDRRMFEPLVDSLVQAFESFGKSTLGRMVNMRQFDRVRAYMKDGRVIHGGGADPASLSIEPTILAELAPDAAVMREEIFGPVLPVIACDSLDQALAGIRSMPIPLAIYAFTRDQRMQERIVAGTRSGGLCFNDTILQTTGPTLPFGGLGSSGMGRYKGKSSFDTFTRERTVLLRSWWPEFTFRYPPATVTVGQLRRLARFLWRG